MPKTSGRSKKVKLDTWLVNIKVIGALRTKIIFRKIKNRTRETEENKQRKFSRYF